MNQPFSSGGNRRKGGAFRPEQFTNPLNRERFAGAVRDGERQARQDESEYYRQQDEANRHAAINAKAQQDYLKKQAEAQELAHKQQAEDQKKWRNSMIERESAVVDRPYLVDSFGDYQWETDDKTWELQREEAAKKQAETVKAELQSDYDKTRKAETDKKKNRLDQLDLMRDQLYYDASGHSRNVEKLPEVRKGLIEELRFDLEDKLNADYKDEAEREEVVNALYAGEVDEKYLDQLRSTRSQNFLEYDKARKEIEAANPLKEKHGKLTQQIDHLKRDLVGLNDSSDEAIKLNASRLSGLSGQLKEEGESYETQLASFQQSQESAQASMAELQAKLTSEGATPAEFAEVRSQFENQRLSFLSEQKRQSEEMNRQRAALEWKTDLYNKSVEEHKERIANRAPTADDEPSSRETTPGGIHATPPPQTLTDPTEDAPVNASPPVSLERNGMDLVKAGDDEQAAVATFERDPEHGRVVIIHDPEQFDTVLSDPRRGTAAVKPAYVASGNRRSSEDVDQEITGLRQAHKELTDRFKADMGVGPRDPESASQSAEALTQWQGEQRSKVMEEFRDGKISVDQLNRSFRAIGDNVSGSAYYKEQVKQEANFGAALSEAIELNKGSNNTEEKWKPKQTLKGLYDISLDLPIMAPTNLAVKGLGAIFNKEHPANKSAKVREKIQTEIDESSAALNQMADDNRDKVLAIAEKHGLNELQSEILLMDSVIAAFPERKKGVKEVLTEFINNPEKHFGSLVGMHQIESTLPIAELALKLRENPNAELTSDEEALMQWYASKDQRDLGSLGLAAKILVDMPQFMGEIGSSLGFYTAIKKGTEKKLKDGLNTAVSAQFKNIVKRRIKIEAKDRALIKAAGKGTGQLTGSLAGVSAITPMHFNRIGAGTYNEMLLPHVSEIANNPDLKSWFSQPGTPAGRALARAGFDTWVELVSEVSGGGIAKAGAAARTAALNALPKALQEKVAQAAFAKAFARINNANSVQMLNRLGKQDVFTEVLEERVGDAIRGIAHAGTGGVIGDEFALPTKEQWVAEIIAMSVPGGAAFVANEFQSAKLDKLNRQGWKKAEDHSAGFLSGSAADIADKINIGQPESQQVTPEQVERAEQLFGNPGEKTAGEHAAARAELEQAYEQARAVGDTKEMRLYGQLIHQLESTAGAKQLDEAGKLARLSVQIDQAETEARGRMADAVQSGDEVLIAEAQNELDAVSRATAAVKVASGKPVGNLTQQEQQALSQPADGVPRMTEVNGVPVLTDAQIEETVSQFPETKPVFSMSESQAKEKFSEPAQADPPNAENTTGQDATESRVPESTGTNQDTGPESTAAPEADSAPVSDTPADATPAADPSSPEAIKRHVEVLTSAAEEAGATPEEAERLARNYVARKGTAEDPTLDGANLQYEINRVNQLVEAAGGTEKKNNDEIRQRAEAFVAENPEYQGSQEIPAFLASLQNADGTGIPPHVPKTKKKAPAKKKTPPPIPKDANPEGYQEIDPSEIEQNPELANAVERVAGLIDLLPGNPFSEIKVVKFGSKVETGGAAVEGDVLLIDPARLGKLKDGKIQAILSEEYIHAVARKELSDPEVIDLWRSMPSELQDAAIKLYNNAKVYHGMPVENMTGNEAFDLFMGHELIRMMVQDKGKAFQGITETVEVPKTFKDKAKKLLNQLLKALRKQIHKAPKSARKSLIEASKKVEDAIERLSESTPQGTPTDGPTEAALLPTVAALKETPIRAKNSPAYLQSHRRISDAKKKGTQPKERDLQLVADYNGAPKAEDFSGDSRKAFTGIFSKDGGQRPNQAATALGFDSVDAMYDKIREELNSLNSASKKGYPKEVLDIVEEAKAAGLGPQDARAMAGAEGVAIEKPIDALFAAESVEESGEVVEPGTPGDDVDLADLEDQADTQKPDDIDWSAPPHEGQTLYAAPAVDLDAMPVIDTGMIAQISEETARVGLIHIDRMIVGEFRGRPLHGGLHYPAQKEMLDAGVVWAFNSKGVASTVLNKGRETNGYIALALMQEGNVIGNKDFLALWRDELIESVAQRKISKSKALLLINQTRKRLVANASEGKHLRKDGRHGKNFKSLDEFFSVLDSMTQTARGNTYFKKQWNKKLKTPATTYGNLLGVKMRQEGMPDPVGIVKGIEHPAFDGLENTTIIGMIKVDPDGGIHLAKDVGVTAHPSYQYVIKGSPVGVFSKTTSVEKLRPSMKGEIMSQQKETYQPDEIATEESHIAVPALHAAPTVEDLEGQLKSAYPQVTKLNLDDHRNAIELNSIEIEERNRSGGIGTRVIDEIKRFANRVGKPVVLTANAEPGKRTALNRFYRDNGFVRPGSKKDYSLPRHTHIYYPETRLQAAPVITPEQDAEYLAAVESGDTDTAQSMVDDAAKAAGIPLSLYHGTTETDYREPNRPGDRKGGSMVEFINFEVFETNEMGVHLGNKGAAESFGEPFRFFVNIKNPLRLPDLGTWNYQNVIREARFAGVDISEAEYDAAFNAFDNERATADLLQGKGYDGIIYNNEAEGYGDSWIAFNPNQIKSADPVTYDSNGKVIPLSERFNDSKDSILYSAPTLTEADYARHDELAEKHKAGTISEAETEEAQGLVDDAAKAAGYDVKAYHGTNAEDIRIFGTGELTHTGKAHFSSSEKLAESFRKWTTDTFGGKGRVYSVYLSNPESKPSREFGIDSIEYAVDDPSQIKSADPFTGTPLKDRFDDSKDSILFAAPSIEGVTPQPGYKEYPTTDGRILVGPALHAAQPIGAWHGTPHKVGKFSTDKIGTGEGAQAFGWGLYFAEDEGVAKQYRDNLSGFGDVRVAGRTEAIPGASPSMTPREFAIRVVAEHRAMHRWMSHDEVLKSAEQRLLEESQSMFGADRGKAALKEFRKLKESGIEVDQSGSLYKVELNVEQDELLDWNKPLSEQSESVKSAFKEVSDSWDFEAEPNGYEIYKLFDSNDYNMSMSSEEASKRLHAAGIKGIKFLDGNSRGSGEGSYNYVIFDEADIKITEENGHPVEQPALHSAQSIQPIDPGNTIFDAALRSLARAVGNVKSIKDLKAWMAEQYAKPFAEPVKKAVDFVLKQAAPLQRLPQEVRALMNELRAKQALGGERAMDVVRSVTGSSKFSDLHMPPELANDKKKQRALFMAMDRHWADVENAPKMEDFSQEIQDYAKRLRQILIQTGEAAVRAGRMSPATFLAMKDGYMPHYYYQHEKAKQFLGGVLMRMKLGLEDIMAQRESMWRIEDHGAHRTDENGLPLLVQWDDGGSKRPRFRSRQHRDAHYEEMILEKAANRIRMRSRVRVFNKDSHRMSHTITADDLKRPHELTPELRGYFKAAEQELRQQYRKKDPASLEQQEEMGLIMDPVYAIARHVAQMEHDNATAEFFNQIALNPEWVDTEERTGFVELPHSRRLGRLSGKWVKEEIAEEITQLVNAPDTAIRLYDNLLTMWKTGKALALDTPIPTPTGWTTMGDLSEGDVIFDDKGEPCEVLFATPVQHNRVCYRVEFSDRTSIVADAEHLWETTAHGKKDAEVVNTEKIRDTLHYGSLNYNTHSIKNAGPLHTPDAILPVDPYVFGYWLGDGHSYSSCLTIGGADLEEAIAILEDGKDIYCGYPKKDKRSTAHSVHIFKDKCRHRSESLQSIMKGMGVMGRAGSKSIPLEYLRASRDQRLALLQGLLDSDGTCSPRGQIQISSSSDALRDGIMELVRSLGYKPAFTTKETIGKDSHLITFTADSSVRLFQLERKFSRMKPPLENGKRARSMSRQITDVVPVDSVPVRCITVSSESKLFLAGEGMIPTHNTVYNPGTHMRNLMGNVLFAQMAGINPIDPRNGKFYKAGWKAIRDGGPLLEEMLELGVLGGDFLTAELRKEIQQVLPESMWKSDDLWSKASSTLSRAWKKIGGQKGRQLIESAYQLEDEAFKAAAYFKARGQGMEPEAAAAHVRKWFPYYDHIGSSSSIRALKRTAMPFFSFQREAIRILHNAAKERPFTLAASMALPILISRISAVALGLDDDEYEEIKDTALRGKGRFLLRDEPMFSMLLPVRNSEGKAQQWDTTNVMPFASLLGRKLDMDNGIPAWQQWTRELISGSPFTGLPLEIAFNTNTFSNKPIWESNMTGGEKAAKTADHVWASLAPPLLPGGTSWKTLQNAGKRRTDKSLEKRDTPQSVARAVGGFDVRSASPNIYDLVENYRKENGLPKPEFAQMQGTKVSRARKAVWDELAQTDENRDWDRLVSNLAYLTKEDRPIKTKQDINRMLFFRNPLMLLDQSHHAKFRRSLTPESRKTLDNNLKDFEEISRNAFPIIMRANSEARRLLLAEQAHLPELRKS